ncbi:MAG: Pentapeptide repeat family protein [Ignavibacteria bacterium]|nr:Pentapeptide repeat family protein [Ignavibacteria bacterium]
MKYLIITYIIIWIIILFQWNLFKGVVSGFVFIKDEFTKDYIISIWITANIIGFILIFVLRKLRIQIFNIYRTIYNRLPTLKDIYVDNKYFFNTFFSLVFVIFGIYFIWFLPVETVENKKDLKNFTSQEDYHRAIKDYRSINAQIIGGLLLFITTYLTWYRIRTEKKLNSDRLTLDQYQKAIDHLKDDKIEACLGGIYSLEKLMNENIDYHWKIVEILSAFIRNKRKKEKYEKIIINGNPNSPDCEAEIKTQYEVPVEIYIQAAITVLGKRNLDMENGEEFKDYRIDLNFTNLYHADFRNLNFEKALFEGSILQSNKLSNAHFEGSHLLNADFNYSKAMNETHFEGAYLYMAKLEDIESYKLHLENADLTDANFIGAKLTGAYFKETICQKTRFNGAKFELAQFTDVLIDDSDIFKADFSYADLTGIIDMYLFIEKFSKVKSLFGAKIKDIEIKNEISKINPNLFHKLA